MDPVTHLLLAASVQKKWFIKKKYALHLMLVSAMFPYLDHLVLLSGPDEFFFSRRGITHGVLFLFLVPVFLSLVTSRMDGGKRALKSHFEGYYYISFLGYGSHIFLDLLTPLGARALAPLDDMYYSIGSVWDFDLFITGVLVLGLYFTLRKKKRMKKAIVIALIVCGLYVSARTALMYKALSYGRRQMDNYIVREVGPMPFSFMQWWYIARLPDRKKQVGVIDLLGGDIYESRTYPAEYRSAMVDAARRNNGMIRFLKLYPEVNVDVDWEARVVRFESLEYTSRNSKPVALVVSLNNRNVITGWKVEY